MKKIEPTAMQELLEAAELKTRAYSGRYMYGKDCLGVDVDGIGTLLLAVAEFVTDDNRAEILETLRGTRSDAMGLGTIVYFPGTPYVGESDICDEDEDEDAA